MVSTLLRITCILAILCPSLSWAQLLVSDRATNQVTEYNLDGEFQRVLIPGDPTTNGGLVGPSAMTLGFGGELLVASQFNGKVLRYDVETGEFLGVFADQVNGPSGLVYNEELDEVLVSTLGNFDSELVMRYGGESREFKDAIGEGTGASGRTGLGYGPDGNLYVSSFANGEFFTGAVLSFDGETNAPLGVFALEPFLSGASTFSFRAGDADGSYQMDLVGLFSNNVARFEISDNEGTLAVTDQSVLIPSDSGLLDFPSAILDLGDGSMVVTNLGNDNPAMGELRPGSIARFDIATGEAMDTFIAAGGEGSLEQPTSLLLLAELNLDCNNDGVVNAEDLACACLSDDRESLLAELNLIEGDLDANGEVDFGDFLTLSGSFGNEGSYLDGDLDCNGTVEFADFLILSANFGQQSSAETQSVPEPSSGPLFAALAITGIALLRRRRLN